MGTLATVLAGKKIRTFRDQFIATVTGDIENVEGVLKITRINVRYLLKLPEAQQESAKKTIGVGKEMPCPSARLTQKVVAVSGGDVEAFVFEMANEMRDVMCADLQVDVEKANESSAFVFAAEFLDDPLCAVGAAVVDEDDLVFVASLLQDPGQHARTLAEVGLLLVAGDDD